MRYYRRSQDPRDPYHPRNDPDLRGIQAVARDAAYAFGEWKDGLFPLVWRYIGGNCPMYEVTIRGEVAYLSPDPPSAMLMDHLKLEACE